MNNELLNAFEKRRKHRQKSWEDKQKNIKTENLVDVPEGLYEKCLSCGAAVHVETLADNLFVCPKCGHHFRLRAVDRIQITVDRGSFVEKGLGYITLNPLFQDGYEEKIFRYQKETNLDEAYIYGYARIKGEPCVIGVLDSYFLMGSMGSVVGEKVTKSFEYAIYKKLPIIIFSSSGGARMQEGIYSLMQMAKTTAAVMKHSDHALLYISVLTHPTTGGVTASFAMLGDIHIAEPGALIGFAGPRVIEQTIREKLPENFQTSEFLLEKGFVDILLPRNKIRNTLAKLLKLHGKVIE